MKIIYRKGKHNPCHCDNCMYSWYKPECTGCGHHNSFWATVIESPQWKKWKAYAEPKMLYDFSENEELGIISPQHFQDFLSFTNKKKP
jgi:hypothetical protein